MMNLKNKKVLVVGLGISGLAACKLLLDKGASLWITERGDSLDKRNITEDLIKKSAIAELGRHSEDFVRGKDLIVVSPGIHPECEVLKWAKRYKIPTVSELELASWYAKCPLICVTGTNGKSTVTSLIDHIFKAAGKETAACGNLGTPLSEIVLKDKTLDFAVVEISSFQLEYIKSFRPYVSVWLNFSYDHLDRYRSMAEYLQAKLRIFENQTEEDWAVINSYDTDKIGGIRAKKMVYSGGNLEAAASVARIFRIDESIIKNAVRNFTPLPHRMEFVASINSIDFIDDSKGTNVHAVLHALNTLKGPVVLILGGRDKGDDFTRLREMIKDKVSHLVVIGEAKDKIVKELTDTVPIDIAEILEDAVDIAYSRAKATASVLLSPGCSSFDMFKDYKKRGEKFKTAVLKLQEVCLSEK